MMQTIIEYFSYSLFVFLFVYARQIHFFFRGLGRLTKGKNTHQHSFIILISARNEEKNIERCLYSLMQQQYPKDKLSIIIIDDQSTDATADIVSRISTTSPFPMTLLRADPKSKILSPKIRALDLGIQQSAGEIIATTDADCIVPPTWIATLNSYFEPGVGLVSGMTVYEKNESASSLFWGIQYLDFISYASVGAGAIGMGRVVMSHGSNSAFRRNAFFDCGGFDTLTHINSGTDSLLAQKIVASGNWSPRFACEQEATIITQPVFSWREVFHQRIRWVGQTAYYPPYMMFFMICTFILFVGLFITIPLTLTAWNSIPWIVLLGLNIVDYGTMSRFTQLTKTTNAMKYYIPTAIIHIPFILISTFGGYFFSYRWKDRTLKTKAKP